MRQHGRGCTNVTYMKCNCEGGLGGATSGGASPDNHGHVWKLRNALAQVDIQMTKARNHHKVTMLHMIWLYLSFLIQSGLYVTVISLIYRHLHRHNFLGRPLKRVFLYRFYMQTPSNHQVRRGSSSPVGEASDWCTNAAELLGPKTWPQNPVRYRGWRACPGSRGVFQNVSKLFRVYNIKLWSCCCFAALEFLCISRLQEISKKKCLGCTIESDKPMATMVTFDISKANGSS